MQGLEEYNVAKCDDESEEEKVIFQQRQADRETQLDDKPE